MNDVELAGELAREAGKRLVALRETHAGSALGADGDRIANAFLMSALREARPGDPILSEEERDDPSRLTASRVWIVDPLDGTREYAEGRDDWAVHVALAIDGHPAVGAVALPAFGVTCLSDPQTRPVALAHRPRIAVSRTRPPEQALAIAKAIDADLIPMGSAGAKAMAVVRGDADAYIHAGGQYEWDSCAPVAVALAAGLHASRLDGSPLIYNRQGAYLPDLLICHPALADRILRQLAGMLKK